MHWLAAWFIIRLLKGRSVEEIQTAFWSIVILLTGVFLMAWFLQPAPPLIHAPH